MTEETASAVKEDKSLGGVLPIYKCSVCSKETGFLVKDKCVGCYVSKMELVWVKCPNCNIEWSKMTNSGLCFDCNENGNVDNLKKGKYESKIRKIFGSAEAERWYTFENFLPTSGTEEAVEASKGFNYKKDNLYLHGQCGRGKTHLAYAVGLVELKNNRNVLNVSVRELLNKFRMKNPQDETEEMDRFVNADILIIDDLGVSRSTDYGLEILMEVINKRTLKLKNGLIVTSNLSLDELSRKNFDDRLSSRLSGELCLK